MSQSVIKIVPHPFRPTERMEIVDTDRLFGKRPPAEPPLRCIRLQSQPAPSQMASARGSRLGGSALLPPDIEWPSWEKGRLSFVGQLDFEQLAGIHKGAIPSLPKKGLLSFFYDIKEQPWGFRNEAKGWRLFHLSDPASAKVIAPSDSPTIPPHSLTGELAKSKLHAERKPVHQVAGHAAWIHGDGRSSAQFASHGLSLDKEVLRDAEKRGIDLPAIGKGLWDWTLLWQINSDDSAGLQWGDCGALYVLIRQKDLEMHAFDRAWVQLQCY